MKSLKIAIIGYGRMGKEVEKAAIVRAHSIIAIIDKEADWENQKKALQEADVAIDFSLPGAAVENIKKCFSLSLPIVEGTTAWYQDFDKIKELCLSENKSIFYASNFSLGVYIFFEMSKKLAEIMRVQTQYSLHLEEEHHLQKIDQPSGTALSLSQLIAQAGDGTIAPDEIPIESRRLPNVVGTHIVDYTSAQDSIQLIHKAHNREGFALGAVRAAEFIVGKKGLYTLKDLFLNS